VGESQRGTGADAPQQYKSGPGGVSVFAPASYRLVKIVHSCFEVVLQSKKHTMVYPGSDPSLGVIALHIAV
jgi:hypothetical protein